MKYKFSPRFQGKGYTEGVLDKVDVYIRSVKYDVEEWPDGTKGMTDIKVKASLTPDGELIPIVMDLKTFTLVHRIVWLENHHYEA